TDRDRVSQLDVLLPDHAGTNDYLSPLAFGKPLPRTEFQCPDVRREITRAIRVNQRGRAEGGDLGVFGLEGDGGIGRPDAVNHLDASRKIGRNLPAGGKRSPAGAGGLGGYVNPG